MVGWGKGGGGNCPNYQLARERVLELFVRICLFVCLVYLMW